MNLKANYSNGSFEIGGLHFPRIWECQLRDGRTDIFVKQLGNENSYVLHQILHTFRNYLQTIHKDLPYVSNITLSISIYQATYLIDCEKSFQNNFAWRITNVSSVALGIQPSTLQVTDVTRTEVLQSPECEWPVLKKKKVTPKPVEVYWEDLEGVIPIDYMAWSEEREPKGKLSRFIYNFANNWI